MAYNRVNWEDSPSTNTPVNATNLNTMDAGIEQNANDIEDLQDDVDEVKSNLPYINTDNLITTITTQGASWTATEDCIITGKIQTDTVNPNMTAIIYINGIVVSGICNQNSSSSRYTLINVYIPCKKGQIVSTRASYGIYDLKIYGVSH